MNREAGPSNHRFLFLIIIFALFAGILCGCAPKRGGFGVTEETVGRNTVEESDREGASTFDIEEDENEPPISRLDPDSDITEDIPHEEAPPVPDEILITPPPQPNQIRGGTWNVKLLGATKANKDNPIIQLHRGNNKIWEAVIQLMVAASIHVLAVQEVYLSQFVKYDERTNVASIFAEEKKGDHPLLNPPALPEQAATGPSGNDAGGSWGFYRAITGDPVFKYDFSWVVAGEPNQRKRIMRTEYCPVLYDTRKLACEQKDNKPIGGRRNIHFVSCRTHDNRLTFDFGCVHFAAKPAITDKNIKQTGELMEGKKIIGGDFNSYRFGAKKEKWTEASQQGTKIDMDENTKVSGGGGFTKIHKKTNGRIGVRKDEIWKILDDLIHTLAMDPFYVPDSKRVLDFGKDIDDDQEFYVLLHDKITDHMPVISDYKTLLEGSAGAPPGN